MSRPSELNASDIWWQELDNHPYVPGQYAIQEDYIAGSVQICFVLIVILVSIEHFFRTNIRDTRLRYSLRFYQMLTVLTMSQGTLCIFQVLTGVDDYVLWMSNEMCYGYSLAASYAFFYFKHKAVYGSNRSLYSKKMNFKMRALELMFIGQFGGYLLFVTLFPLIESVGYMKYTNPETGVEQIGPRVQYMFPQWQSAIVMLGDTGISITCLLMFAMPVLEISESNGQNTASTVQANREYKKNTRTMLWRNVKCAGGAIGSTAVFMISSFFFTGPWWITLGCGDLMFNVVLCRLMFKTTDNSVKPSNHTGTTSGKSKDVSAVTGADSVVNTRVDNY